MNKGAINKQEGNSLSVPVLFGLIVFDNSDFGLHQFETETTYIWCDILFHPFLNTSWSISKKP